VYKTLTAFLFFPLYVLSGDLVLNPGQYQVQFDYFSDSATQFYDTYKIGQPIEMLEQASKYNHSGYSMDLRYGASNHTTLVIKGNWLNRDLDMWSSDGLESYYIGVQLRRISSMYHSFQWEIGFWGDGSYNAEDPLPLGPGENTWQVNGSYMLSLNPFHGHAFFDTGYLFRGGDLSNQWTFNTGVSMNIVENTEFQVIYNMAESQDHSRIPFDLLGYPIESGYQKAGVGFKVGLGKRFSLTASYEKVLKGRNFFQTSGYHTGFAWLF